MAPRRGPVDRAAVGVEDQRRSLSAASTKARASTGAEPVADVERGGGEAAARRGHPSRPAALHGQVRRAAGGRGSAETADQSSQVPFGAEVLAEGAGAVGVEREDRGQRAGGGGRERVPVGERLRARAARVGDAEERRAVHRARAQPDGGDDGEAPAAAAQGPEQGVVLVHPPPAAVGGDDVHARHAVEREAEGAAGEAHPAAEHQPAERHRRAGSGRDRHAAAGQRGVDRQRARARADRRGSVLDADVVEAAQVHDDRAVAGRVAVVAVAARTADERDVVAVGPAHHGAHVGAVADADDRGRATAVPARVEHDAGVVVAAVAGREDAAADRVAQRALLRPRERARRLGPQQQRGGADQEAATGEVHASVA